MSQLYFKSKNIYTVSKGHSSLSMCVRLPFFAYEAQVWTFRKDSLGKIVEVQGAMGETNAAYLTKRQKTKSVGEKRTKGKWHNGARWQTKVE